MFQIHFHLMNFYLKNYLKKLFIFNKREIKTNTIYQIMIIFDRQDCKYQNMVLYSMDEFYHY
jgi:hypothetical protein